MSENNNNSNRMFFLINIKSIYLIKQISDNLIKTKFLNIIKYNKKLQKRLDITLNDFKRCGKIEISLTINSKSYYKFINIKDNKQYYHIYYDDSKEEEKEKSGICRLDKDEITIKIIIDNEIKSLKGLFENCESIRKISFL